MFSYCWGLRILYTFWITVFFRYVPCKYFLPKCSLSSHTPSTMYFWRTEAFNFKKTSLDPRDVGVIPRVGKIPWSGKWQPTSVFLPGKFQGERSLEGYISRGCKESDKTEHIPKRASLVVPAPFVEETDFAPLYYFYSFIKDLLIVFVKHISGCSILLHQCICLSLSQYHSVLFTVAL